MLSGNKQNFEDFKKFILENGIIATTAGVTIGIASKDLVLSLSGDILVPSIIILLYWLNVKSLKHYLPSGKTKLDLENFLKNLLTWVIVVISTFAFVKITFHYFLGIETKELVNQDKDTKNKK
jgi:large-conductance mechanosensitive channel